MSGIKIKFNEQSVKQIHKDFDNLLKQLQSKADSIPITINIDKINDRIKDLSQEIKKISDIKVNFDNKGIDDTNKKLKELYNSIKNNSNIDSSGGIKLVTNSDENGIKNYTASIKNLKGEITTLKYIANGNDGFKLVNIKETEDGIKKLEETNKRQQQLNKTIEDYEIKLKKLSITYGNLLGNKEIAPQLESFKKSLKDLNVDNFNKGQLDSQFKRLQTNIEGCNKAIKLGQKNIQSFGDALKTTFTKYVLFDVASEAIQMLNRAILDTIQTVSELDKTMTNISRVTNLAREDFKDFMLEANQMAKDLHKTTNEVLKSIESFSKMGFSEKDTQFLTELSQMVSSVGDIDIDQAVSSIITLQKGFKLSLEGVKQALDGANTLANENAYEMIDLAVLWEKASSTMKVAGNSVQETMSLFGASQEVVNNADVVSTALKTLSLRLRGVDEEGKKNKELVSEMSKAFKYLGISATDVNGNFKSTFDILNEAQNAMKGMNKNSKEVAYNLELMFGKKSANVGISILENWDSVEKMMKQYENSTNSMANEYEIYSQSVEAYNKRMKASIEELQITLLNSDSLKFFYSMSTGVIESITALGKLNYVVTGITLAMGGLTLANRKAMLSMKEFQVVSAIGGVGKLGADIKTCTLSLLGFKTATEGAKVSAVALNLATAGLTLGLPLLAMGVGAVINHFKKAKEEAENFAKELDEFNNKNKNLDSLIKKQENLEKSMIGLDKTTSEYNKKAKELLDIRRQIAELMPSAKTGEDEYGNSIATNTELTKELVEQEKIRMAIKAKDAMDKMGSEGEMKILENELEGISKVRDVMMEIVTTTKGKQLSTFFDPIANMEITLTADQVIERLDSLNGIFKDGQDTIKKWNDNAKLMNEIFGYSLPILNTFENSILKTNNSFNDSNKNIQDSKEVVIDYSAQLESLNEQFDTSTEKLDFLTSALNEYDKEQIFSGQLKGKILEKYPEMIAYMDSEKLLYDELKKKQNEEVQNQQKCINQKLMISEEFYQRLVNGNNQTLLSVAKAYDIDLSNFKNLAEAKLKIQNRLNEKILESMSQISHAENLVFSDDMFENESMKSQYMKPMFDEIKKSKEQLKTVSTSFDDITTKFSSNYSGLGVKDPIGTSSGGSSPKKETKEIQDLIYEKDRYYKLTQQINKLDSEIDTNETLNANNNLKKLQEENTLLNKKLILSKQLRDEHQKELVEQQNNLRKNGFVLDADGIITNQNELIKQRTDSANKLAGEAKEKAIKIVEQLKKDIEEYSTHLEAIPNMSLNLEKMKNDIESNSKEVANILLEELEKALNTEVDVVTLISDKKIKELKDKISLLGNIDTAEEKAEQLEAMNSLSKIYSYKIENIEMMMDILTKKMSKASKEEREKMQEYLQTLSAQKVEIEIEYKSNQDQIEQINLEMIKNTQDKVSEMVKSRYEKEKEYALKNLETVDKQREQYHKAELDRLKEKKDKQLKIYDEMLDEIDKKEKERDYNNERNDTLDEKAKLQAQLNMLSGVDTREAEMQRQELKDQIAELDKKLSEQAHDKEIELSKDKIQNEKDKYSEMMDEKIGSLEKGFQLEKDNVERQKELLNKFYEEKLSKENIFQETQKILITGQVEYTKGKYQDLSTALESYMLEVDEKFIVTGELIQTELIDGLERTLQLINQMKSVNLGSLGSLGISSKFNIPNVNKNLQLPTNSYLTENIKSTISNITNNSTANSSSKKVELKVDKLIEINGNADSNTIKDIEKNAPKVAEIICKEINKKL